MAVRSYLDQQIQNEAAARAAGAPVTRGSFTDIANREVGSGFVDRALGTIPANTPPPAPAFQQTFLNGLLAQLQSATPEQQQQVVSQFAPQIQGLLGPAFQQEDGRDPDSLEKIGRDYKEFTAMDAEGNYLMSDKALQKEDEFNKTVAPYLTSAISPIGRLFSELDYEPTSSIGKLLASLNPNTGPALVRQKIAEAYNIRAANKGLINQDLVAKHAPSILKGGYLEAPGGLYGRDAYDHAIYDEPETTLVTV
jgi:hypothetical protein